MKKVKFFTAALLVLSLLLTVPALARPSQDWEKVLKERTALMWVDGQVFEEFVLNARARLSITWLPVSLNSRLDKDRQVDEWVTEGLSYYFSTNAETRQKMKKHEILALNYKAQKNWAFDPTELRVGDYRVTEEDILGHPELRGETGELRPGTEGTLFVRVPSLKPGSTVKLTLGADSVELKLPKR